MAMGVGRRGMEGRMRGRWEAGEADGIERGREEQWQWQEEEEGGGEGEEQWPEGRV